MKQPLTDTSRTIPSPRPLLKLWLPLMLMLTLQPNLQLSLPLRNRRTVPQQQQLHTVIRPTTTTSTLPQLLRLGASPQVVNLQVARL